jgi:hypothetical protein
MGVAVATAREDPRATAATTTGTRATTAMVCHVQIPSRYRCLDRRMIIRKRTRVLSRATRLCRLPPGWIPSSFV